MVVFQGPDWLPLLVEFFPFIIIGAIVPIIVLTVLWLRARGSHRTPGIERMSVLTEVSREGHFLSGDLIGFPDRTEDTGYVEHPDWRDSNGEQYHADVDIRGIVPLRFLDVDGNIKEFWPFFNIEGQIVAGNFESMLAPFLGNHNGHDLIDKPKLEALSKELVTTARSPEEMLAFLNLQLPTIVHNGVDQAHPLEPLPMNPRDAAPFFLASSAGRQGVGKLLRSGMFWAVVIPAVIAAFFGGFLLHAFQVHLI